MAATYEQMQAMHTLLEADNARECVDALLNQYAKESFDNAQYLLGKCQKLSEIAFMHCDVARRRNIDAVQVLKDINWHHKPTPVSEFESGFNQGLNQAMWIITHAPTLTPPNAPLTIEQLREMDGEPVWVVPTGTHKKDEPMWCVLKGSMALIPGVDCWLWDFDGYGETWMAYRRPPGGEA